MCLLARHAGSGRGQQAYPVARSGHQHRPCRPCRPCRLSPVRPPCQWHLHPRKAKRSDPQSEPSRATKKRNRKTGQPKARTFFARSAVLAVLARRADGASLAISTRSAVLASSTVHAMNARCTIQAVFPGRAFSTCASNRAKCEAPQSQSRLFDAPKHRKQIFGTNGAIMCERAWRSMRDRQGS